MKKEPFSIIPYIQIRGIVFEGTITDFVWTDDFFTGPSLLRELFIKVRFNHKGYPGISFEAAYKKNMVSSEMPFFVPFLSNLAFIAGIKEISFPNKMDFHKNGSPLITFENLPSLFNETVFKNKKVAFKLRKMDEYTVNDEWIVEEPEIDTDEEEEGDVDIAKRNSKPYPYPPVYESPHGLFYLINRFVQTRT